MYVVLSLLFVLLVDDAFSSQVFNARATYVFPGPQIAFVSVSSAPYLALSYHYQNPSPHHQPRAPRLRRPHLLPSNQEQQSPAVGGSGVVVPRQDGLAAFLGGYNDK
ncbi:hypothetical protein BDQ12DRAFT_525211 [Crucibulum laeve]|uniref:Secreted protein n=1 Tax=Crucibulum laeve TaxID=68775 RepID=A0A5C3LGB0_9AGAR|nr:hypothetical protein BDQ12DRAFT_525211 [Crucibulum laeve]